MTPHQHALLSALVLFGSLCVIPTPARACGNGSLGDAMAWGAVSFEVSATAGIASLFVLDQRHVRRETHESIALISPWGIAVAMGVIAYCAEWTQDVPDAVHGGLWTGASGAMLGAMIDRAHTGGEIGTWTAVLGGLGGSVGLITGWAAVDKDGGDQLAWWYAAPPVGTLAGLGGALVYTLGSLIVSGGEGVDDSNFLPILWTGNAIGVGAAYTAVALDHHKKAKKRRTQLLSPLPKPVWRPISLPAKKKVTPASPFGETGF